MAGLMSSEGRRDRIKSALAAASEETERIPWKGGYELLPVVTLPLDATVLNPRSHRIRAQLESHPERATILADPFSEASQEAIAAILRETTDFGVLKANLKQDKQRYPGVVTSVGLLVNANTRAVALGDLKVDYIRVAVLPEDAADKEIVDLELRLQMQRDFKRDYSFANELLFVEDLLTDYGYGPETVALTLGWAASEEVRELERGRQRVDLYTRLYSTVRRIQGLSAGRIPLTFFDDDAPRSALVELDRSYEVLKDRDQTAADRLWQARIAGLLLGVKYRSLRLVGPDFIDEYLIPHVQEAESQELSTAAQVLKMTSVEGGSALPGLDILGLEDEDDGARDDADATELARLLAETFDSDTIDVPLPNGTVRLPRDSVVDQLREVMEAACAEAGLDQRNDNRLAAPAARLKDAEQALRNAAKAYARVASDSAFNRGKFELALKRVKKSMDELRDAVAKRD